MADQIKEEDEDKDYPDEQLLKQIKNKIYHWPAKDFLLKNASGPINAYNFYSKADAQLLQQIKDKKNRGKQKESSPKNASETTNYSNVSSEEDELERNLILLQAKEPDFLVQLAYADLVNFDTTIFTNQSTQDKFRKFLNPIIDEGILTVGEQKFKIEHPLISWATTGSGSSNSQTGYTTKAQQILKSIINDIKQNTQEHYNNNDTQFFIKELPNIEQLIQSLDQGTKKEIISKGKAVLEILKAVNANSQPASEEDKPKSLEKNKLETQIRAIQNILERLETTQDNEQTGENTQVDNNQEVNPSTGKQGEKLQRENPQPGNQQNKTKQGLTAKIIANLKRTTEMLSKIINLLLM